MADINRLRLSLRNPNGRLGGNRDDLLPHADRQSTDELPPNRALLVIPSASR